MRRYFFPATDPTRNAGSENGQALVLFALGLAAFLGLVAMSVDVGHVLVTRRQSQDAADAAVLAAAAVLMDGGSYSAAVAEAQKYASANGFDSVTVNRPPTTGSFAGNMDAVEVVVGRRVDPYLAQVVGAGPWNVSARAVSDIGGAATGFGVIALNPSVCRSLQMGSSSVLDVTNGGIFVNSSCRSEAMEMGSSSFARGTIISVVGGVERGSSSSASPAPLTGQQPVPDPWANIPVPSIAAGTDRTGGGCEFKDRTITLNSGTYRCAPLVIDGGTVTFAPGDYTFQGGLKIDGQARVNMGRGVYVMKGGGFTMTSNTRLVNTTGLLIYNTCNGACNATNDWFHVASSASFQASPYGGQYANLVIFQNRALTAGLDFDSSSVVNTNGERAGIYAKSAALNYNCSSTIPLQFVADTVHMGSSSRVVIDVNGLVQATVAALRLAE